MYFALARKTLLLRQQSAAGNTCTVTRVGLRKYEMYNARACRTQHVPALRKTKICQRPTSRSVDPKTSTPPLCAVQGPAQVYKLRRFAAHATQKTRARAGCMLEGLNRRNRTAFTVSIPPPLRVNCRSCWTALATCSCCSMLRRFEYIA